MFYTRDYRSCEAVRETNELDNESARRPPVGGGSALIFALFFFLGYTVKSYYIVRGIDIDYSCSARSSSLL